MMKPHRKFVYILAALLTGHLLFNLLTWKLFVRQLMVDDPECVGGDLTRLGYISGSKMCRQENNDLPVRHLEWTDYRGGPVDLLTIGDSFSNGGGGGKNTYYQDYIASLNAMNVLNMPQYKELNLISTVAILNNNGVLDRLQPRIVLIECAENQCLHDLPDEIDFSQIVSEKELAGYEKVTFKQKQETGKAALQLDFFSEANVKFVKNNIRYRFSDHAFDSQVYKARLDRPFFSVKEPYILLFFQADIKYRQKYSAKNIARLNDYLNQLADKLAEKRIKLYFMPCADKFNVYSIYLLNKKYPESQFFEELRKLPKRYAFIDTKALLREELAKGEKNIYYADDTHWSWKASKKVFETVRFQ